MYTYTPLSIATKGHNPGDPLCIATEGFICLQVDQGAGGPDEGDTGKIERKYARRPGEEYFDDERFDRPTSFPYGDLVDDQPIPGEEPPEEPIAARSDTAAGPIYLPDEAEKVIKVYDEHGTLVEDIDPIALMMLMKAHEED